MLNSFGTSFSHVLFEVSRSLYSGVATNRGRADFSDVIHNRSSIWLKRAMFKIRYDMCKNIAWLKNSKLNRERRAAKCGFLKQNKKWENTGLLRICPCFWIAGNCIAFTGKNMSAGGKGTPSILTANVCHSRSVIFRAMARQDKQTAPSE